MTARKFPALSAATLALSVGLAGCGGGLFSSNAPTNQQYVLQPATAAPAATPIAATIRVLRPTAQPGLETNRIALTRPGNQLDYYAAATWAGPLTDVMAALLAQSVRASARFENVDSDRGGFGPDFVLAVAIRHFEAVYGNGDAPRVRVQLEATLGSRRERETLANVDADVTVQADANRLGSVIVAFEQAAQQAIAEVIDKSATAAATALAAEPPAPERAPGARR